ncbi:AAA family ATPase [Clostridium arbusti]|uniref:AAA family ATPase n=1 Tax=Clostridium arbusti TaxID=1137848 RepID=UPI00028A113D|nr:AAA family ATPase [Clostridium arbusti]
MYIKKLYIRDFGIYNNAELDNISPGIVVLGGKNRAGKSTLLKILRHFPYGFNKSIDIPNCKVEYEVEAQICISKEEYNVRVKGFSAPLITAVNNKKKTYKNNLYGEIDSFTYKEIFTISLDELQNIHKKNEKVQAILLGAGLKDIIKIPKLIIAVKKEAEKIGGKNGNPRTKLFKADYSIINEGIAIKEEALLQVDKFGQYKDKLSQTEEKIEKEENIKLTTEDNIFILEVLKNNYNIYREIDILALQLEIKENKHIYNFFKDKNLSLELMNNFKNEYISIDKEYNKAKAKFSQNLGDYSKLEKAFIINGNNIKDIQLSISGLEEKIKNYNLLCEEYKASKREINKDIVDMNHQWRDDFSHILKINTEEIAFVELCEQVDELKKIKENIEVLTLKIKQLQQEKNIINNSCKIKENSKNPKNSLVSYCIVSLAFILLGIFIYRFSKIFGVTVSVAGIIGASAYNIISEKMRVENIDINTREINLDHITAEICSASEELEKLNKREYSLNRIMEDYKLKLDLDREIPLSSLKDYFRLARDIKKRVMDLQYDLKNINAMKKYIILNLEKIAKVIIKFSEILSFNESNIGEDIISNSKYLFETAKKLNVMVIDYENIKAIGNIKQGIEEKIKDSLQLKYVEKDNVDMFKELDKNINYMKIYNKYKEDSNRYINLKHQLIHSLKIDKIKQLLITNEDHSDSQIFHAFKKLIKDYINVDEIDRQINELNYKLKDNRKTLDGLRGLRLNIKENMNKLYKSEDIAVANEKIDRGRKHLKNNAKEYAVYNAAAFMLEKLQKNFIDNAKDTILGSTGEILSKITEGELISVLPTEDLTKYDFKTYSSDGTLSDTTDILSRGTKEQLFLSVRFSRIKDIKPKLPVVIDDSLVNFDYKHLKNVVKVLRELSKENQVFILTCHAELVKLINKEDEAAQFFKIETGKFSETKGELLSEYLS